VGSFEEWGFDTLERAPSRRDQGPRRRHPSPTDTGRPKRSFAHNRETGYVTLEFRNIPAGFTGKDFPGHRQKGADRMVMGAKVFTATKAKDREELGEVLTRWIRDNPRAKILDKIVTQSSDSEFHCLSITLFYELSPQ
jgi:hypothetical protein